MTIDSYDPLQAPDPEQWLALDENKRIDLATDYHIASGIELPNVAVHATMHAMVESQIAMGDEIPVRRKVQQLMAQGLDRHDAIHAVGSVLINRMSDLVRDGAPADDPNVRYYAALRRPNARRWLRSG